MTKISICGSEFEMGGPQLTELRSSNDIIGDTEALRERMREDGYILIRGFHDREKVLRARAQIWDKMNAMGKLDSSATLDNAVIANGGKGLMFGGTNEDLPAFLDVVNAPETMDFFSRFLGGPSLTLDYKWLRAVGNGGFTGAHYDIVYMGRGTKNLYTLWTPFGDTPVEMGTLAVLLGSHRLDKLKATYGEMDVDRDHMEGWLSRDPQELLEKFGGRWATTDFRAGDAIFFGMYLLHSSTENRTNNYRISCDTRYQLASEPVDERWIGRKPKGHEPQKSEERVSIEDARKQWGV
ncbi:phytanoyl-CoA dioxygenase family protein [Paenibacillus ginsengarvi]|uniref:Phytanoyl-CoA dioxygenase n=1 Tax=Paenibacillus ginsengarvi TaxID=400777 RepID=A0A3B0CKM2_9BACL|nr:phytanoyl-CoA dioxygenase family protein [Paenibacillus ginsengarvi]RKN84887.1 phytanoyl-CoA dioxygenase [Paenibacillus ginsengarvi]